MKSDIKILPKPTSHELISLHTKSVPSIHVESTQRTRDDGTSKKDEKSSAKKSPGIIPRIGQQHKAEF